MILFILLLCTTATFSASTKSFTEEDARQFIEESSEEFFDFFDVLAKLTFTLDDKLYGDFFEVLQKLNILESAAKNLTIMAKKAENYPYETFKDEEVKLGIKNIRMSSYLYILEDEYFKKLLISTKFLKDLGTNSGICNFKDSDNCKMSYIPDIKKIISKSDDEEELKYYWKAWRDRNNEFGPEHLQKFIDLFKKAAVLTGTKPLDLWYRVYLDSNFFAEMEKVMKQIQLLYKKLHAYMRYDLNKQYGDKIVPKKGPIPYHLFEKVLVQTSMKNVIEAPHPVFELPDYDSRIKKRVESTEMTLLEIANEFYESMGIEYEEEEPTEEEDEDNIENHVKNREEKSEDDECTAEIYAQSRYYYLKTCPQINFKKYLQHHGWAAPIYFVQQKSSLPFANFQSYNFEIPTGEAIILSASSPKHLSTVGLLTDQENGNDQITMNRLFKMSINAMLNIPMYFVHSKVMNDLLTGEVTVENVNEYYWKLMKQFAGVVPPVERGKESFDFPYQFYEDLENNHQTTKFVSEIVRYQIYKSLCKKSEIIQPALDSCDFYKSKVVGDTLKEFMELGSTKNWRETLSVITGDESGLSGKAISEYYKPITVWLTENIEGNGFPIGW